MLYRGSVTFNSVETFKKWRRINQASIQKLLELLCKSSSSTSSSSTSSLTSSPIVLVHCAIERPMNMYGTVNTTAPENNMRKHKSAPLGCSTCFDKSNPLDLNSPHQWITGVDSLLNCSRCGRGVPVGKTNHNGSTHMCTNPHLPDTETMMVTYFNGSRLLWHDCNAKDPQCWTDAEWKERENTRIKRYKYNYSKTKLSQSRSKAQKIKMEQQPKPESDFQKTEDCVYIKRADGRDIIRIPCSKVAEYFQ